MSFSRTVRYLAFLAAGPALILTGCKSGSTGGNNQPFANAEQAEERISDPAPERQTARLRRLDPQTLIGKSRAELTALLGKPVFTRTDMNARLWRYRQQQCVLDLFLYPDPGSETENISVTWVEARKPDGSPANSRQCLTRILNPPRTS